MSGKPTVAVLGASRDREKYGNKAVRAYLARGYEVFPVNLREDEIEGLPVFASVSEIPAALDRVTVYLKPDILLDVLPQIAAKGTRELYFNPGTERDDVVDAAKRLGLEPILACSIVEIGLSPSQFA